MKSLLLVLIIIPQFLMSQTWEWAQRLDGTIGTYTTNDLCVDQVGNVYAICQGSGYLAKVIKYTGEGQLLWSRNLWTGRVNSIDVDADGHLYLVGDSSSISMIAKYDTSGNQIWKILGTSGSANGVAANSDGSFYVTSHSSLISKFDSAGNHFWSRYANATGIAVCSDNAGNCYITGKFSDTALLGAFQLIARGKEDIFIAKYNPWGQCVWAKRAGGDRFGFYSEDCGIAIASDRLGNIYVTGSIVDTADFDSYNLIASNNDVFIAKCDTNGNVLWLNQAKGGSDQEGRSIAVDKHGNVLVGGAFVPYIEFDGNWISGWNHYDAFLATYDSAGNFMTVVKAGGSSWNDYINGIAIDGDGNTYVTGKYSGTAYFESDSLTGSGTFIGKIDQTTNIEKSTGQTPRVNTFPNPTHGSFYVQVETAKELYVVTITDIVGKLIVEQYSSTSSLHKFEGFSPGTYFITITDRVNSSVTRKLVVL